MIFNYSRISRSSTRKRSGISLFLFDDSDIMQALLTEDLTVYVWVPDGHGDFYEKCIVVPKDSFTDFASCPRVLWNIFAPIGKHTKAAVVHDYLYTIRTTSRQEADYVFRQLMLDNKVGFTKRWLMWMAVRAFGWRHWNEADNSIQG